jgi:hypothetical protein
MKSNIHTAMNNPSRDAIAYNKLSVSFLSFILGFSFSFQEDDNYRV